MRKIHIYICLIDLFATTINCNRTKQLQGNLLAINSVQRDTQQKDDK